MESEDEFPGIGTKNRPKFVKTYSKSKIMHRTNNFDNPSLLKDSNNINIEQSEIKTEPEEIVEELTTRKAAILLVNGKIRDKVCRFCLNITSDLTALEEIFELAGNGSFYKITMKEMVATLHPFKVADDPNLPNKICGKCIDLTISSYLFTQQCEQSERALHNCFEDIYEKLNKLDPLVRLTKRGRRKHNPNYNTLYVEHEKVIDYAEPLHHLTNTCEINKGEIYELECLKCCEILPNLESLMNHMKIHPKSMWFNCRICGQSFPKLYQIRKHLRLGHDFEFKQSENKGYYCECGVKNDNYNEHLEHIEKHKFKNVMEHLIEKKMDRLCAVCLDKGFDMATLDQEICLHGGCKELSGNRTLFSVLESTLPEMNILENLMGTKICKSCLNNAITAYVFIKQSYFVRNRLNTCVSFMLNDLIKIKEPSNNICIEIDQSTILKAQFDELLESEIEVLEDEFRIKSDEESEAENKPDTNILTNIQTETQTNIINGHVNEKIVDLKRNNRKSKYTCPLCSKHFISDYFLKKHIIKHLPKKVQCEICYQHFSSKFNLCEHKKMVHFRNIHDSVCCKECGRLFINKIRLQFHQKRHYHKFCQLCEKYFKSQRYFDIHIERHLYKIGTQTRNPQNCSFCEKDCANDNEFSLHVNKVHLQIKPYNCDMCEKQFYTEYNLRSHKKLHSIRSREKCNFCKKLLRSRKQLVVHIRKHIEDKPFSCQICNQTFYSQYKVRKHMRLSHGGQYCCKYCKITFRMKKDLEGHVNTCHNIWV